MYYFRSLYGKNPKGHMNIKTGHFKNLIGTSFQKIRTRPGNIIGTERILVQHRKPSEENGKVNSTTKKI